MELNIHNRRNHTDLEGRNIANITENRKPEEELKVSIKEIRIFQILIVRCSHENAVSDGP